MDCNENGNCDFGHESFLRAPLTSSRPVERRPSAAARESAFEFREQRYLKACYRAVSCKALWVAPSLLAIEGTNRILVKAYRHAATHVFLSNRLRGEIPRISGLLVHAGRHGLPWKGVSFSNMLLFSLCRNASVNFVTSLITPVHGEKISSPLCAPAI